MNRYMQIPQKSHLKAAKSWLFYRRGTNLAFIGFTNVDWERDKDFIKLTRRHFFVVGGTQSLGTTKRKTLWPCHLQNLNSKHS